jgi:tyrosine-protein kinase Etk/Wzc
MTPDLLELSSVDAPLASQPRALELDLFGLALILIRNAWFIVGCGAIFFIVTAAVLTHAKPRFASTAVMIVPQGNVTSGVLQAQLSLTTADLIGGGYEIYGDILESRTVADHIISDYNLKSVYKTPKLENAEAVLAALTKVKTEREGLISVTVQDTDPQRAADLANDYLHQLDLLNGQLVLTSIGQQRAYLEREMVKEKDALANSEVALKEVEESGSGLTPDAVAKSGLNALDNTRAQLRAEQIKLASLLTSETDANPEVVRTRSEIAGLNVQLNSLQSGSVSTENGVPIRQMPQQELEYTRREREVLFHETLFDLLAKQFEEAKQQEARTPSIVQVLDPAVPSSHKAWPPRTYYCGLATIAGVLVGIFLVALRSFASAYIGNPRNAEKLLILKASLRNPFSPRSPRESSARRGF